MAVQFVYSVNVKLGRIAYVSHVEAASFKVQLAFLFFGAADIATCHQCDVIIAHAVDS